MEHPNYEDPDDQCIDCGQTVDRELADLGVIGLDGMDVTLSFVTLDPWLPGWTINEHHVEDLADCVRVMRDIKNHIGEILLDLDSHLGSAISSIAQNIEHQLENSLCPRCRRAL